MQWEGEGPSVDRWSEPGLMWGGDISAGNQRPRRLPREVPRREAPGKVQSKRKVGLNH